MTFHYLPMTSHAIYNKKLMETLNDTGPITGQPKVLGYLGDYDGASQKEIAAHCYIEAATLTLVLNGIEIKGPIQRRRMNGNRRTFHISLTDEGWEQQKRVQEAFLKIETETFEQMEQEEWEKFIHQFVGIHEHSEKQTKRGEDTMSYGVIINCIAVFIGGLLGAVLKDYLPGKLEEALPGIFGPSVITMSATLIIKLESLSAVILAVILGTVIGKLMDLETSLMRGPHSLESRPPLSLDGKQLDVPISMTILFCFSGTGIFRAMNPTMTDGHSILIAKAIMDFFTAVIFGITTGYLAGFVAIPQFVVEVLLFRCAGCVFPYITRTMFADFKTCGGIITLVVGLKIAGTKKPRVLNTLPVIVLVLPFSTLL